MKSNIHFWGVIDGHKRNENHWSREVDWVKKKNGQRVINVK